MVICSKSIIKGVVDANVNIRPILLKTWTKVEYSGQHDFNDRNFKDSMTIASWENLDGMFTLDAEIKNGMHVSMATEKRTLTIKLNIFLKIMAQALLM